MVFFGLNPLSFFLGLTCALFDFPQCFLALIRVTVVEEQDGARMKRRARKHSGATLRAEKCHGAVLVPPLVELPLVELPLSLEPGLVVLEPMLPLGLAAELGLFAELPLTGPDGEVIPPLLLSVEPAAPLGLEAPLLEPMVLLELLPAPGAVLPPPS